MKALIIVLTLAVFIVGFCGITDAENIVTDGLISYWTFDQSDIADKTIKDVWGENNATIVGNPTIVNGHLKDALKFDGIKDYVNLTTLGNFGAKLDYSTFEAWIKTDYKDNWSTIIKSIGRNCNKSIMIWGIDINRKTADLEDIKLDPFGPRIVFKADFIQLYLPSLFKNKGGCSLSFLRGEYPISDGEWHHLVFTTKPVDKNGAEQTERALFIDGTLNRISQFNPKVQNAQYKYVPFTDPVYLGAGNNRGKAEGFFNGIIDEVRIYDRPLTEAEIMQNFQSNTGLAVEHKDKLTTVWGTLKKR